MPRLGAAVAAGVVLAAPLYGLFTVAPANLVVMVDGACPAGWPEVTRAQGQLLLSTSSAADDFQDTDVLQIPRLSAQRQPSHSHAVERQLCLNSPFGQTARRSAGLSAYSTISGTATHCDASGKGAIAASSTAALPLAQVRLCKSAAPSTVPFGSVAHFDDASLAACPPGWTAYAEGQGRFLVAKDTGAALGSAANGAAPLSTATVANPQHVHGLESAGPTGLPRFYYGSGSQEPYANTGSTAMSGMGAAAGLNVPLSHLLACKASAAADDKAVPEANPPAGALLLYDDTGSPTGGCPLTWSDAPSKWAGKLLLAVPAGEAPGVWASGGASGVPALSHSHIATGFFKPPVVGYSSCCAPPLTGSQYYGDSSSVGKEVALALTSSDAFAASWTACAAGATCNSGGGQVLVRYGQNNAAGALSQTSAGALQFNYKVVPGAFTCGAATFGNPQASAATCEFALALGAAPALPTIALRLCASSGFTSLTASPSARPSARPSGQSSGQSAAPSAAPTPRPSGQSSGQSAAPSAAPTSAAPTLRPSTPTTLAPTASPTKLTCDANDAAYFKRAAPEGLDPALADCARKCGADLPKQLDEAAYACVADCVAPRLQLQPSCGRCIESYYRCARDTCNAVCGYLGRAPGAACLGCTQLACDKDFAACSLAGLTIPVAFFGSYPTVAPTVPPDDKTLLPLIIGATAGGVLTLAIAATVVMWVRRPSGAKPPSSSSSSSSSPISSWGGAGAGAGGSSSSSFGGPPWSPARPALAASPHAFQIDYSAAPQVAAASRTPPDHRSKLAAKFGGAAAGAAGVGDDKLVAAFAFIAQANDELSVRQGEPLRKVKQQDAEWCLVESAATGNRGLVPASYLRRA